MKKMYLFMFSLMIAMAFSILPTTCQAKKTFVDDVACFNNDLNYPYIAGGIHAGTVVDVSSCYVITNNDDYTEVGGTSHLAYYNADDFSYEQPIHIRYYKANGKILMMYPEESGSWGKSTSTDEEANNAYYLIRVHLGV